MMGEAKRRNAFIRSEPDADQVEDMRIANQWMKQIGVFDATPLDPVCDTAVNAALNVIAFITASLPDEIAIKGIHNLEATVRDRRAFLMKRHPKNKWENFLKQYHEGGDL